MAERINVLENNKVRDWKLVSIDLANALQETVYDTKTVVVDNLDLPETISGSIYIFGRYDDVPNYVSSNVEYTSGTTYAYNKIIGFESIEEGFELAFIDTEHSIRYFARYVEGGPYKGAGDDTAGYTWINISELPKYGESKDFYATQIYDLTNETTVNQTIRNFKFTLTNLSDDETLSLIACTYNLSFRYEHSLPQKQLWTIVEKRDGTVETTIQDLHDEDLLANGVKSVKTEIEDVTETTGGPVNEVMFDGVNSFGNIFVGNDSQSTFPSDMYSSYDNDNLTELNTNERFTSSQFQISSTGFIITFSIENKAGDNIYAVTSNFSSDGVTISNSPYAHDDNSDSPLSISSSELPSVGQSKDFYPTMFISNISNTPEEYTGTDIVFTITNIDGTNYTLSFIWNKTNEVTVTSKSLKTTLTRNDDSEVVTTNPISGLLQNVTFNIEEKIGNVTVASSKEYSSWIMIGDENGSDSLDNH